MNGEQKKFLDKNGLKILWNQISMHDYPNNAALTSVINAIDANKADRADIPRIDTTLSAAGAAADAKAVGQAIENIELTPGPKGERGIDGKDGITPHIGENGNWWIGDEDTGISVEVADEQINDALEAYMANNPLVKSVNGTTPDENGNVDLQLPGSPEWQKIDVQLEENVYYITISIPNAKEVYIFGEMYGNDSAGTLGDIGKFGAYDLDINGRRHYGGVIGQMGVCFPFYEVWKISSVGTRLDISYCGSTDAHMGQSKTSTDILAYTFEPIHTLQLYSFSDYYFDKKTKMEVWYR